MTRFQVTISCTACGHRYKRIMTAPDADALEAIPDPPCPSCTKPLRQRGMKFNGRAPSVGGSLVVRAVDHTAQIVMEDHKMTDLRSDVREGESMAPKLAPRLQAMADNMFTRPKGRSNPAVGIMGMNPRAIVNAAVNGRFNTSDTVNPIAIQHQKRDRPPIQIVGGDGVKSR